MYITFALLEYPNNLYLRLLELQEHALNSLSFYFTLLFFHFYFFHIKHKSLINVIFYNFIIVENLFSISFCWKNPLHKFSIQGQCCRYLLRMLLEHDERYFGKSESNHCVLFFFIWYCASIVSASWWFHLSICAVNFYFFLTRCYWIYIGFCVEYTTIYIMYTLQTDSLCTVLIVKRDAVNPPFLSNPKFVQIQHTVRILFI